MIGSDTSLLLRRVWQIPEIATDRISASRIAPYSRHYQDVLPSSLLHSIEAQDLADLVDLIKASPNKSAKISEILNQIHGQRYYWLPGTVDDNSSRHALNLALRLWLFVKIDATKDDKTIKEAIQASFNNCLDTLPEDGLSRLSDDFSAKNLERRGGFTIHWTSDLTEHLSCIDRKVIKIFRHGSVLQSYLDRSLYPSDLSVDLLTELDSTFYLLFPYEGAKAVNIARKESKKRRVDLVEAGWADDAIGEYARLQLTSYPRFRNRLAEIQRRYDAAKPIHPKQWWYDRRQRSEWAALMITVLVLILTIFTVITSIMQVYAAFSPKYRGQK